MGAISAKQEGKVPAGSKRSARWPAFRRKFLLGKCCEVCGGSKKLEAHHIKPFHTHPSLELNAGNLIALCENKKDGVNCHLLFGHLGNFKSNNPNVQKDATAWRKKIKNRPK